MATQNVDLYSYLPGIEVTADEILAAELLAYQVLSAKFPALDLREGTGLRDLVIAPNAVLLAMVRKALVYFFAQNTLTGVTDESPRAFADSLLSNFFMTRKEGNKAIINVRMFFAKSKSIALPSDVFFSPDNTLKYFPSTSVSYSADQLTYDSSSNEYYIDLDLTAEKAGVSYNITGGSLIYFSNFDPFFLHAEINFLRQTAEDLESNTAFIKRTGAAISTRNLINVPSIASKLLEDFSLIDQVTTFGFGDVEMVRDQIKVLVPNVADPIWLHNGGKVDVFCRTPLSSSIVQLNTDSTGKINLSGSIYKFNRSPTPGTPTPDTVPVLVTQAVTSITRTGSVATVTVPNHGYSSGDLITIAGAFPLGYNGTGFITVTGANTFTYPVSSSLTSPATGTITSGIDFPYSVTDSFRVSQAVTSITRSGETATATSLNHGLMVGERVKISGANQTGYNGVVEVTSTPTKDTFTYLVNPSTITPSTGTVTASFVDRQNEVGYSEKQNLVIDFGLGQANKTASFLVYFHQNIDGIQAYLDAPERRVVCGDYLARGHNLTALDITITSYNGVAADQAVAAKVIKEYLDSLNPGQPFIMADLLSKLYIAEITTIKTPLDVTYIKYWNDNLGTTSGTIVDTLNPEDTKNIFVLNSVTTTSASI